MSLINYLPLSYRECENTKELQKAFELQVDEMNKNVADLLEQVFVENCNWGIELWEKYLDIPINPLETLAMRKNTVIAKLKGQGVSTVERIKTVTESYTRSPVTVVEHFDQYWFEVSMYSSSDIDDLLIYIKSAIEEIKPAHLNFQYELIYTKHKDLKPYNHQSLNQYTHWWIRRNPIHFIADYTVAYAILQAYKHSELYPFKHNYISQNILEKEEE